MNISANTPSLTSHNISIILHNPDMPANTGNIIRLCANCGCDLHLVKPMGFNLNDTKLRRAGLDYHEYTNITIHESWDDCLRYFTNRRIIAIETNTPNIYTEITYTPTDVLLFGSETVGLTQNELDTLPNSSISASIPMRPGQRSLNLANSVAIVAYEAWRQLKFN